MPIKLTISACFTFIFEKKGMEAFLEPDPPSGEIQGVLPSQSEDHRILVYCI